MLWTALACATILGWVASPRCLHNGSLIVEESCVCRYGAVYLDRDGVLGLSSWHVTHSKLLPN
jgi:hypothetical protein